MNVWVARQPIFDRKMQLYAYELLFRPAQTCDHFDGSDAASATTQVIAHTFLGIGLDNVLSGRKAFVNFDRRLLMGTLHSILPRKDIVLEVLENVEADPEVLAACRSLRAQGYTIALDDFVRRPETEPLTEFAQIVKVDVQATSPDEQQRMLRAYRPRGIAMLAEKVETREEFRWALAAGYDYFQGYFFARPAMVPGKQIPPLKAACLGLLSETQREELDFDRIGTLIAGDVALSWQLLRYVNSALLSRREGIRSVQQALNMVGENNVRHWAALATLPTLAKNKPGELVTLALVRGHFSEYLAKLANKSESSDAFLMGLFSVIDALIDLPLYEALSRANVAPAISAALLENAPENDPLQTIHRLVGAWESGDWAAVSRLATQSGIPEIAVGEAYAESTLWAQKALQGIARRAYSRRGARQPSAEVVTLKWADAAAGEITLDVRLINLSAGGLGLHAPAPAPLNSLVAFDAPGLGISGKGSVRYCHSSGGGNLIGIECRDESIGCGEEWTRLGRARE
ncbi:MAG: HDOD domain-containing protein [Bryobacteraceae bacterium]|jgi:EAL and modified HD-GYP domain-containing signal transduction protein